MENKPVNQLCRHYENGKPVGKDLRALAIDELIKSGGNQHTGKLPYGAYTKVAKKLRLSHTSIRKYWKQFVSNQSISPAKQGRKFGSQRSLSGEDRIYLKSLLSLKPCLFKKTAKDYLERFSNHLNRNNSISLSLVFKEVRERLNEDGNGKFWSMKVARTSYTARWKRANIIRTRDYFAEVSTRDPSRLYFVDECNFNQVIYPI